MERVTIRVPATSANLGPGFDCLGIALELFNLVTLERADRFQLTLAGEGTESLSKGMDNLVYKAVNTLYSAIGAEPPPLSLACRNDIPLSRGLGSSCAAVVAGLVAANELNGKPLPQETLLKLAGDMEGHLDNAAPALLGGCQIVVKDGERVITSQVPLPMGLKAVLFIPDFPISTQKARQVLPKAVSRSDAVFNLGRVALLVNSLATGRLENLNIATKDRLHQTHRKVLFPQMDDLLQAALQAGALGAFLSGSGSTILALVQGDGTPIGEAIAHTAQQVGVSGKVMVCPISPCGAHVVAPDV